MGYLTELPRVKHFAPVPHISKAVSNFISDNEIQNKIKALGQVFVKYGVYNDFGLILVHRHFDLNEMEIVVESLSEDELYSSAVPWKILEGNIAAPISGQLMALPSKSALFKEKEFVVPQTWYFTDGGQLQSYEFLSESEKLGNPPESFVIELYKELKALGCSKLFGIRRLGHRKFERSWEISPKDVRANLTKFGNELPQDIGEEGMVTVVWAFSRSGDVQSVSSCSSSTWDNEIGELQEHD